MTVLEDLAAFIAATTLKDLSGEELDCLGAHLLDTVCATLTGAATPEGEAMFAFQNHGEASKGIGALSVTPLDDVAVRCAITRMSEIDDIHLPSGTTPGSIVIPVAITLAHRLGVKDAETFAGSLIAGYEAMTRLGRAVNGQELVYKGIWTTYFTAPFGAAAVTARLGGLDASETANALSIALTLTAGRMGRPGSGKTSRWLAAGHAARSGCFAALSAGRGYEGDPGLLDGDWLLGAHGIENDPQKFTARLGAGSVITEISIKPYCSAKQMVAAISGFEEILARGIDPGAITKILVSVPESYAAMIDHGVVAGNRLSSVTSAPYQLALAAYHPEGLYDAARAEYMLSDDVTALMEKVGVATDADLAAHLPANWPARVEVTTADRSEQITVIDAPGDPARPFDLAAVRQKFASFADGLSGETDVGEWTALAPQAISSGDALEKLTDRFMSIGG